MPRKYLLFSIVTAFWIVADQATKWLVRVHIPEGRREIQVIDGLFSFVHAENRGAAFGMMSGLEPTLRLGIFAIFTLLAVGVLLHMLWQLPAHEHVQNIAIATITGGAIGNAWDRAVHHQVTDFLRVYTENPKLSAWLIKSPLHSNEWPSFNIADSAIFVGLGLFVIHYLFLQDDEGELEPAPPEHPLDDEPPVT